MNAQNEIPPESPARSTQDWLVLTLATGFFLGMVRPRVATVATLLGIPLALVLYFAVGWVGYLPPLLLLWLVGIPLCGRAADIMEREDPGEVTYDEFTTLPLVYFLAPDFGLANWPVLVAGFALHRFFDILKPLGINRLQRFPGGLGIMIDDVLASLYALTIMHLLYYFAVL